jgi:hypothetical protein
MKKVNNNGYNVGLDQAPKVHRLHRTFESSTNNVRANICNPTLRSSYSSEVMFLSDDHDMTLNNSFCGNIWS